MLGLAYHDAYIEGVPFDYNLAVEWYRRAIDAGAMSVQEPIQKDDEDKRGGVNDAGGTTWWIATRVSSA